MFFGFGLSGMAALIYEVVWTRSLSTVMGSSTYALSTMLAAFMTGLSVGGWFGARLSSKIRNMAVVFALCELGIGLMGMVTIPLINALKPLYISSFYIFHLSFNSFSVVQFAIIFMVMGIPTTLMGITFPTVIKLLTKDHRDAGEQSGHLYCVNTFGAILGSILAGFMLIPAIGTKATSFLAASLNIFTAMVILSMSREFKKVFLASAAIILSVTLAEAIHDPGVPLLSYYSANRYGNSYLDAKKVSDYLEKKGNSSLVFHYEGIESNVYLLEEAIGGEKKYILINSGKLEAGDDVGFALLAYLPYLYHTPADKPAKALNIGLGSGKTLSYLSKFPLRHIDSVEISKGILEANRRFLCPDLFNDPRITHVQADGRNFLLLHKDKYDMIIASPSWAVEMSSAGMLTDEFYSLAAKSLHDTGVFATWLDYFLMAEEDLQIILRTFRKNFRHATVWHADGDNLVLVGSNHVPQMSESYITGQIESINPSLGNKFRALLPEDELRNIPEGMINSDDRPVIEFHNAKNIILGPNAIHKKF